MELRFTASEIKGFVGHMLDSLDSYSEDEVDGELFFFMWNYCYMPHGKKKGE